MKDSRNVDQILENWKEDPKPFVNEASGFSDADRHEAKAVDER